MCVDHLSLSRDLKRILSREREQTSPVAFQNTLNEVLAPRTLVSTQTPKRSQICRILDGRVVPRAARSLLIALSPCRRRRAPTAQGTAICILVALLRIIPGTFQVTRFKTRCESSRSRARARVERRLSTTHARDRPSLPRPPVSPRLSKHLTMKVPKSRPFVVGRRLGASMASAVGETQVSTRETGAPSVSASRCLTEMASASDDAVHTTAIRSRSSSKRDSARAAESNRDPCLRERRTRSRERERPLCNSRGLFPRFLSGTFGYYERVHTDVLKKRLSSATLHVRVPKDATSPTHSRERYVSRTDAEWCASTTTAE